MRDPRGLPLRGNGAPTGDLKELLAKLPTLIDVTLGTPVEPHTDVGAQASNNIKSLVTHDN